MAIDNIGLTISVGGSIDDGVRLIGGGGAVTPYLAWTTVWRESQLNYRIQSRWRGIPKGGTGDDSSYTPWSSWEATELPAASCHPTQRSGSDLWWWFVPLASLFDDVASINGGSWSYASRIYDQVELAFQVTSVQPSGWQSDEVGYGNYLFIGCYPDYEVTDVYMQGDWLVITYDAEGWTRKDDRWEILALTKGGRDVIRPNAYGSQAGRVERLGWITVPRSDLQQLVQAGDSLYLHIRWNAAYRPVGLEWTDWSGPISATDHGSANDPTGDVSINDDGSISVGVGDSGQGGGVINSWQVTIDGGGLEFDEVQGSTTNPNLALMYPPLDTHLTIQIQGSTATGGTSGIVTEHVFVPSDGAALIDPIDSAGNRVGAQLRAVYNVEVDSDRSRDKEVVKFAGRSLPSVAFGVGGTGTVDVSWLIPRPRGSAPADPLGDVRDAGLCVVRVPGGGRWLVAVDSASVGESYDHPGYSECSIGGQEVV